MPYYSPSTGGFYAPDIHGTDIPDDAAKISARRHLALLEGQAAGGEIVAGPRGPTVRMPTSSRAELLERAVRRVKREARRRILAIASLELQANDAAAIATAALEISLHGAASIDFAPALDRRLAIDAVRAASDEIELELEVLGTAELLAFVAADHPRWP